MAAARAQRVAAAIAGVGALALGAAVLGVACSSSTKPAVGLEVLVTTADLQYPKDYDALEIKVTQSTGSGLFGNAGYDMAASTQLPTSLSIAPGTSGSQTVRIVVRALKGLSLVVESTAQVDVPTTSVEELVMVLDADCENVNCPPLQTCAGGACQSIDVPGSDLKAYDPSDLNAVADATVATPDGGGHADASPPEGGGKEAGPDAGSDGGGDAGTPDAGDAGAVSCNPSSNTCSGCCDGTTMSCQPGTSATACGGRGTTCQPCQSGDVCQNGACVAGACGTTGAACCPFHECSGGCCDDGICVAVGSACSTIVGICQSNGACGACGAPTTTSCCVVTSTATTTCTSPYADCVSNRCEPCGQNMQSCCPGNICVGGFACAPGPDGGSNMLCVGCGGNGQACCPPAMGIPGAPPSACQSGLACNGMGQCRP
jgi:hypothetical protein